MIHVKAQYALGHLYETGYSDSDFDFLSHAEGKFVCQDFEKAYNWYREAALQEYAAAQYKLAKMCEEGRGVEQNEGEAIEWYRKAAAQGYKESLLYLGYLCDEGRVELEYSEMIECYKMMAEQGGMSIHANRVLLDSKKRHEMVT